MSTDYRPIIEQCEGADADDMSALMSAFRRIWRQQARPQGTDLHCEQFLRKLFAVDRSRAGVQWTWEEIADSFLCAVSMARRFVGRLEREFGLVVVIEERYARGGQGANRYKIDWPTVRAINMGQARRSEIISARRRQAPGAHSEQPGAHSEQPGAHSEQPGAHSEQPYKDRPSISTSIKQDFLTTTTTSGSTKPVDWSVVVVRLADLKMTKRAGAVDAARRRGLTPVDVIGLIERWERLRARHPDQVTVAWLYRWCTGDSDPPPEDSPLQVRRLAPSFEEVGF